ncbi:Indolepyruvate oxidoreductase subunit IorA [uncultured archaeon]|nr:Indolepyruvate oxidoreductase subunit IorA [uncultured archaeon]
MGDFGLAHSGISGLINAVHNRHELVVIVLQNEVSAMTGGQDVPDLTELVRACVRDTGIMDPKADIDIKDLLERKINAEGISVILARARCPRY